MDGVVQYSSCIITFKTKRQGPQKQACPPTDSVSFRSVPDFIASRTYVI